MSDTSSSDSDTDVSRDDLRLREAEKFLKTGSNFKIMHNLLMKRRYKDQKISIRTLEWFVVTYAPKKEIAYELEESDGTSSDLFQVNPSYQDQLGKYTKKEFDPFCRSKKRMFHKTVRDGGTRVKLDLQTNVAQINFFNWALSNGVLDYIVDHYAVIMNSKKRAEACRRDAKNRSDGDSKNQVMDHNWTHHPYLNPPRAKHNTRRWQTLSRARLYVKK